MPRSIPNQLLPAWPTADARLSLAQLREYCQAKDTLPAAKVASEVQRLVKAGAVERKGGAWQLSPRGQSLWSQHPAVKSRQKPRAPVPSPRSAMQPSREGIGSGESEALPAAEPSLSASPWAAFRRALRYYIECVRLNERPSCALYGDRQDYEFIFAYLTQRWWPEMAGEGSMTLRLPLTASHAAFVRQALAADENHGLYVGYPVEVAQLRQKGETAALLRPVCCIPAVVEEYDTTSATLRLNFEELDLNSDWLQRGVSREEQGAFLTATGMAPSSGDSPELPSCQSLASIVAALNGLLGDRMPEGPIDPLHTLLSLKLDKAAPGIYNGAVAYIGKRVKYSVGLLRELRQLTEVSDACLNRTSLRPLFLGVPAVGAEPSTQDATLPVAPFLPLNDEQERAVEAGANDPLVVITGPPGTGKSQVGAALLANLAWHGQTAVFSSRNHKAIDAVVPRTNELAGGESLIYRQTDPASGVSFTWRQAVRQMLAAMSSRGNPGKLQRRTADMQNLLKVQQRLLAQAERWSEVEAQLGQAQGELDGGLLPLPQAVQRAIRTGESAQFRVIAKEIQSLVPPPWLVGCRSWYRGILLWFWARRGGRQLVATLEEHSSTLRDVGAPVQASLREIGELDRQLAATVARLDLAADLRALHSQVEGFENEARSLPPLGTLRRDLSDLRESISRDGPLLLKAVIEQRGAALSQEERHRLLQMRGVLAHKKGQVFDRGTKLQWERFFQAEIGQLLRSFPMWAVTALSARHALPLGPGVVDVAVIDEASQCEIPSILPLLYRARRAVIIGDPLQFRPVITLKAQRNAILLRQHQLTDPTELVYDYVQFSIFDCAANAPFKNVSHHLLRDHFRCHQDIASYCNQTFYDGTLRLLTDPSRLRVPAGRRPGIVWTEVEGEAKPSRPSGATCQEEADAICEQVALLVKEGYVGTVGVISPFRRQAEEIRMRIENRLPAQQLLDLDFACSTAHAFQGGERDVIFFSPVLQPGLPDGSRWLLADVENRNLLNVSASRARAVLHVVGNREACLASGIPHLVGLARPPKAPEVPAGGGFESPWERTLHDGLKERGIPTVTQFPILGYRLDLALPDLRIDIEVDGERYHRDPVTGRRKAEDLWRDLSLQGAGWHVIRFWVFELRENLAGCVDIVEQACRQRQEDSSAESECLAEET